MKKVLLALVGLLGVGLNSWSQKYIDAYYALQKSELIRSVPRESHGFLTMYPDSRVSEWNVTAYKLIADADGNTTATNQVSYVSPEGLNHVRVDVSVFSDPSYSYTIQGMDPSGTVVIDVDVEAINGNGPEYQHCVTGKCIATTYAYEIAGYSPIYSTGASDYQLALQETWNFEDNGVKVPYYEKICNAAAKDAALIARGIDPINGLGTDYFPEDGCWKVKKDMGPWRYDQRSVGSATNPCMYQFPAMVSRMNWFVDYGYAPPFTPYDSVAEQHLPLSCGGAGASTNDNGGSGTTYAGTAVVTNIFDCLEEDGYFDDENTIIYYPAGENGEIYGFTLITDCLDGASSGTPCGPGYIYTPGIEEPCVLIEEYQIYPFDLPVGSNDPGVTVLDPSTGFTVDRKDKQLEKGLYVIRVMLADGFSFPLFWEAKDAVTIFGESPSGAKSLDFTTSPNPINRGQKVMLQMSSLSEAATVEIRELPTGQVIYTGAIEGGAPLTIDYDMLQGKGKAPVGLYNVRIYNDHESVSKKLMVK